jgi:hypothetical protein
LQRAEIAQESFGEQTKIALKISEQVNDKKLKRV